MGERALEMVSFTLRAMANGGIHDHVGQVRESTPHRERGSVCQRVREGGVRGSV